MMIGVSKMHIQTIAKLTLLSAMLASTAGCTKQDLASADANAANGANQRTVKTGAGLDFSVKMQKAIAANGQYSATLSVSHDYAGKNLTLSATADDALRLGSKSATLPMTKGRNATWTIPFTTTTDGVYYINIIGTVAGSNGKSEARAYAIRVEVGDQSKNKKPAVDEMILPAEETIS
jgi:hypothetical protein